MTVTDDSVIITANDFATGEVVYFGTDGWQPLISQAQCYPDPEQASQAMSFVARPDEVVGAYVIGVNHSSGQIIPTQFKEKIRALGPTNYDHGKQAAGA